MAQVRFLPETSSTPARLVPALLVPTPLKPTPLAPAPLGPTQLALIPLPVADAGADTADDAGGPGWFASSWELRRGLDVREGLPADANLSEWLMHCLGHEARPAQRAAMRATASPRSITAIA